MKWRPISEAPRDGTRILVSDGNRIWLSYWTKCDIYVPSTKEPFRYGRYEERMGWFDYDDDGIVRPIHKNLTHWMPLPEPPEVG